MSSNINNDPKNTRKPAHTDKPETDTRTNIDNGKTRKPGHSKPEAQPQSIDNTTPKQPRRWQDH